MRPIKWIRKNERKIMTFVVIFIMVGFVGGTALTQILGRMGKDRTLAYFNEGASGGMFSDIGKVTSERRRIAINELQALRGLQIDLWLRYLKPSKMGTADYRARLLSYLLFPDQGGASGISQELKLALRQGQYIASTQDIDKFFKAGGAMSDIYWILLKAEAKMAGCVVTDADARTILIQELPRLARGATAGQVVASVVKELGMSEDKVIHTFADLLGILTYAEMVGDSENVTLNQIRGMIGRKGEMIDSEFVKIDAASLVAIQEDPGEEELEEHFSKYRQFSDGDYSDENPYGFGYQLPPRVGLEYVIVKLREVESTVVEPDQDKMMEFYQDNYRMYQVDERIDPNNPNSETVPRLRPFSEVVVQVRQNLLTKERDKLANRIINDAVDLVDSGFAGVDLDTADSSELKDLAGDYKEAAVKLTEKYGVDVYAGKTGLLSMDDLSGERYLSMLSIEGSNQVPVRLTKIAFAVDQIALTDIGPFEISTPKMWETIGPMGDGYSMLAIVRVVDAQPASQPENLDTSYSRQGAVLSKFDQDSRNIYSVRKKVADDVKILKAMDTAKARAKELVETVVKKGWDEGIEEFNKLHSKEKTLRLAKWNDKTRVSLLDIETAKMIFSNDPAGMGRIERQFRDLKIVEAFYSVLPAGEEEALNVKEVIESQPDRSVYVVKDIKRTSVTDTQHAELKARMAYEVHMVQSESTGIIHFRPDNILKRMEFKSAEDESDEQQDDF